MNKPPPELLGGPEVTRGHLTSPRSLLFNTFFDVSGAAIHKQSLSVVSHSVLKELRCRNLNNKYT